MSIRARLLPLTVSFLMLLNICLAVTPSAGDPGAVLEITPTAFLPGVTQSVQLTCRPTPTHSITQIMTIQIHKESDAGPVIYPIASFVTSGSPVVEALGVSLNASASGYYNPADPRSSFLGVELPHPADAADGTYRCTVNALNVRGLVQAFLSSNTLTSFAKNDSVPGFYQSILRELRNDLDTLASDLDTLSGKQVTLNKTDNITPKLYVLGLKAGEIRRGQDNDVISALNDVDQRTAFMRSELARLRAVTPETKVHVFAYVSSNYITVSNNASIVFNMVEQHTDDAYSASNGIFTAPLNGTYYFRTGLTGIKPSVSATITVNDQPVASLDGNDDFNRSQATACVVLRLAVGDEVRVVKKTASSNYINGYYPANGNSHLSYFMGVLLW